MATRHLRPSVAFAGRPRPAYQLCGYAGFLLAFVQSLGLTRHFGLSQLTLLGITGTVILTFYLLTMISKILANAEVIVYYHHEIAVITTSALFLRLTKQPVLPYLDVLVLGLGLFLACGRIGCFLVGCCHGRPCRWGARYGEDHADAGFPRYLVGVRLFPIQAVESVFALCTVACGLALLLKGHLSGSVLVFYVITYGGARFCIEFFRGDGGRPYLWGFSEAQWTSFILAAAVSIGASVRLLPASKWHWIIPASFGIVMVLVTIWRRLDPSRRFELLHPRHLWEVARALDHLDLTLCDTGAHRHSYQPATIHVAQTSRGYILSMGEASGLRHYSLSRKGRTLSLAAARRLARLIVNLGRSSASFALVKGGTGMFHILSKAPISPEQSAEP